MHKGDQKEFSDLSKYYKKNYLKYLPKDKNAKILDIGSGMGHFLYFLEKEGYKNYLGVDYGKECVSFCKEKNFKIESCDIFDFLENNQELFDTILMNDIIEHFNKDEIIRLLKLIYRNLKDNGKLIIKTPNLSNPVLASNSRYDEFTHETGFTEVSLAQVLKICNFKNVEVYPLDIYVFYLNPLNYIAKLIAPIFNLIFRLIFLLYGRRTTKIFTKHILAVAKKDNS